MKKVLIVFVLLIIQCTLSINAQEYYYSAGKKNYIFVDSTIIIAKVKNNTNLGRLETSLHKDTKIKRVHKFKNKDLIELKFEKSFKSEELLLVSSQL